MSRFREESKRWWKNSDKHLIGVEHKYFSFKVVLKHKRKCKRHELLQTDVGMLPRCPKEWNKVFHTVPKRRLSKKLTKQISLNTVDLVDGVCFPLGNRKPHVYYW